MLSAWLPWPIKMRRRCAGSGYIYVYTVLSGLPLGVLAVLYWLQKLIKEMSRPSVHDLFVRPKYNVAEDGMCVPGPTRTILLQPLNKARKWPAQARMSTGEALCMTREQRGTMIKPCTSMRASTHVEVWF